MKTFRILPGIFLFALIILEAGGHGHSHDHDESPAFKYSRKANEDPTFDEEDILDSEIVDLPPQRPKSTCGHGHSHDSDELYAGHSHGHHGHSHGDHGHSHGHGHRELSDSEREALRKRLHANWDDDDEDDVSRNVWVQAIMATLAISVAPFFILFLVPLDNTREKQWLLKIVLSFASGSLLGDAFLHLIPHAMMATVDQQGEHGHGHGHGHGHSHGHGHNDEDSHSHDLGVGLGVLSGVIAFLVVEKVVRILSGHGHGHGHGHAHVKAEERPKVEEKAKSKDSSSDKKNVKVDQSEKKADQSPTSPEHKPEDECEVIEELKVAGFLNLFADIFHNFTDGLAIGASYTAGEAVGNLTTLTILLHEIPHEVGDFAILIQSGMTPKKAILMQLLTAVGALTGCLFSLAAPHGLGQAAATSLILPFTAGGFIYIATVSVIPELLEGAKLKQSILEIFALLAGVAMMALIAQYE